MGETALCVQLGDCSYNCVIMWHIWVVALPKTLLQGEEVLLVAGGEPCAISCAGTGWCTSTIQRLKPKCQDCAPPWGFCHTPMQGILLPEYPTPALRLQRYMEFAGRNTTKWNHCIWKCVFSCPKSSVHKQNVQALVFNGESADEVTWKYIKHRERHFTAKPQKYIDSRKQRILNHSCAQKNYYV